MHARTDRSAALGDRLMSTKPNSQWPDIVPVEMALLGLWRGTRSLRALGRLILGKSTTWRNE